MSHSLIRRGLDLYADDIQRGNGKPKKIGNANQKLSEEELVKVVGTNKKGFRRKLKRLQIKHNAATLKDKKVKSQPSLYETHTRHDMTDANIKALNLMRLLNKDEMKVMERAAERHEAKSNKPWKGKKDKKSKAVSEGEDKVLTEDDFQKFFKEYSFT